jgi:hypothetical protein
VSPELVAAQEHGRTPFARGVTRVPVRRRALGDHDPLPHGRLSPGPRLAIAVLAPGRRGGRTAAGAWSKSTRSEAARDPSSLARASRRSLAGWRPGRERRARSGSSSSKTPPRAPIGCVRSSRCSAAGSWTPGGGEAPRVPSAPGPAWGRLSTGPIRPHRPRRARGRGQPAPEVRAHARRGRSSRSGRPPLGRGARAGRAQRRSSPTPGALRGFLRGRPRE